ncbi:Prefoldin beta-like protein [Myriangium duriaei CBS 260.36]|uniref:Prefoldin beta-like protein n=1 Tax=Myriangium duriaei CBS 260.36 TaxID=1168546 RepID=A0A9P4IRR8_9PEZI|nr:Prefoldin beta-like protein [Myriangium duriaei CBS 260.36]
MASQEQQQKLQALSDEYQDLQSELQNIVTARQKLDSQFQENKSVQKEFSSLSDDANIYKLVGPVLLKQDTAEAKSTVDGRLEYIEKEIKRIEEQITGIQQKSETKKLEIYQLQSQLQQGQPGAA